MLKFFALHKQKITGISNTAFYNQIGITFLQVFIPIKRIISFYTF
jgi:hypothetical protein